MIARDSHTHEILKRSFSRYRCLSKR